MLSDGMDKNWNDIVEENINDKGKVHALRWEVYKRV